MPVRIVDRHLAKMDDGKSGDSQNFFVEVRNYI
jgi:hypothetical protein